MVVTVTVQTKEKYREKKVEGKTLEERKEKNPIFRSEVF